MRKLRLSEVTHLTCPMAISGQVRMHNEITRLESPRPPFWSTCIGSYLFAVAAAQSCCLLMGLLLGLWISLVKEISSL